MKVDSILMDIVRGQWAMSLEGLSIYAPIAHEIITRKKVNEQAESNEPKSLMNIIDSNGRAVMPDKNGVVDAPEGSVAVVDMIGPIMKYGDWCSYGAVEVAEVLRAADANPNIIGIVLNIDGPGGAVSAIGPFMDFAQTKTKPIVSLLDQCCSLHYWAACVLSDHKMAANNVSANIGSIGVMTSFADNREYLEKLGYKFHEINAPESTDKNLAFKLALEGKYEMIQKDHLSPLAVKFQEAVRAANPKLKEIPGVLTGKTFGADKALEYGMIDSIGSLAKAIDLVKIMSEINHYKN